ncbi:hypothetical protein HDU96_001537, partial [Phlyctochytrium bullatum]
MEIGVDGFGDRHDHPLAPHDYRCQVPDRGRRMHRDASPALPSPLPIRRGRSLSPTRAPPDRHRPRSRSWPSRTASAASTAAGGEPPRPVSLASRGGWSAAEGEGAFGEEDPEEEDQTVVDEERIRRRGTPYWAEGLPSKPLKPSVLPRACLFIANLNAAMTDAQLHESVFRHFEAWGPTRQVKVQRDQKGRPFGFVQYQNIPDAKRALREAATTVLDGRELRVEPANVNRTLFVSKFDADMRYQ